MTGFLTTVRVADALREAPVVWKARPLDIERLAARFEPAMRRALLQAWETLKGRVPVGQIVDAMGQGYRAVMDLLVDAHLTVDEYLRATEPLTDAATAAAYEAAKPFGMRFDLPDPVARQWVLSTTEANGWLRYNITPEGRQFVQDTIRQAFMEGGHPFQTARAIRGSIGLNPQQAAQLRRFGEGLTQSGVTGSAWERAVARQEGRLIAQRAEVIARTETIRAA